MDTRMILLLTLVFNYAFSENCDCPVLDQLERLLQKEMFQTQILADKVTVLEAWKKTEETGESKDKTFNEKVAVMEELIRQAGEESKTSRQTVAQTERLNTALKEAWKDHKTETVDFKRAMEKNMAIIEDGMKGLQSELGEEIKNTQDKTHSLVNQTNREMTAKLIDLEKKMDVLRIQDSSNLERVRKTSQQDIETLRSQLDSYKTTFSNELQRQVAELKGEVSAVLERLREIESKSKRDHSDVQNVYQALRNDLNGLKSDMSRRVTPLERRLTPSGYRCYGWNDADRRYLYSSYALVKEKIRCEIYADNVFTHGENSLFPGCLTCWCCTRIYG